MSIIKAAQAVVDAWDAGVIGHVQEPMETELDELRGALASEPDWPKLVRKLLEADRQIPVAHSYVAMKALREALEKFDNEGD